jgi:hypothetical protein
MPTTPAQPLLATEDADRSQECESARSERLLRRFLLGQAPETLVAWILEGPHGDARFRDELLHRMRADHPTTDEAHRELRNVLDPSDETEVRGAALRPALHRLYDAGVGEPLLGLLRDFISSSRPFDYELKLDDIAFELASWVMADLHWTTQQQLDWYSETYLATGFGWHHAVNDFEPTPEALNRRADALVARVAHHTLVWNDRLVLHTAEMLCKAGRADEAYALLVRTSSVTGHWFNAVIILRDQPIEWQRTFARPLVDAIKRWNGPENVQEFALETAEECLGAVLGQRVLQA